MRPLWLVVALLLVAPACSTYRDDLVRSQHAFEENRHEQALALLRAMEPDTEHLTTSEQARYAYLRGMTDFRVGYKTDARHWLAVAKAMDEQNPGLIPSDWRGRLDTSLGELDAQVWAGGMEAISNANDRPHAPRARRAPKNPAADESTDDEREQAPPAPKKPKPDDEDE